MNEDQKLDANAAKRNALKAPWTFVVDTAATRRAVCHFKGCKKHFDIGQTRVGQRIHDHYKELYDLDEGATRFIFYHVDCYVAACAKMRKNTTRVRDVSDIHWIGVSDAGRQEVIGKLQLP